MRIRRIFTVFLLLVPASAFACKSDMECKGDRICESGKCVSPGGVAAPAPTLPAGPVAPQKPFPGGAVVDAELDSISETGLWLKFKGGRHHLPLTALIKVESRISSAPSAKIFAKGKSPLALSKHIGKTVIVKVIKKATLRGTLKSVSGLSLSLKTPAGTETLPLSAIEQVDGLEKFTTERNVIVYRAGDPATRLVSVVGKSARFFRKLPKAKKKPFRSKEYRLVSASRLKAIAFAKRYYDQKVQTTLVAGLTYEQSAKWAPSAYKTDRYLAVGTMPSGIGLLIPVPSMCAELVHDVGPVNGSKKISVWGKALEPASNAAVVILADGCEAAQ